MHSIICREACSGGDSRLTFYCSELPCAGRSKRARVVIPCLRVRIWLQEESNSGSLLLLLHPDLVAIRTLPLPLPVIDVALNFLHWYLALWTSHLYSSIALGPTPRPGIAAELATAATFDPATISLAIPYCDQVSPPISGTCVWLLLCCSCLSEPPANPPSRSPLKRFRCAPTYARTERLLRYTRERRQARVPRHGARPPAAPSKRQGPRRRTTSPEAAGRIGHIVKCRASTSDR